MPTCDTVGVLAPVATIVAAAQANDALKLALNREDILPRSLLDFDSWTNTRRRLDLVSAKDPACTCCALRHFDALDARTAPNTQLCGQNAVQISPPPNTPPADLAAVATRWRTLGTVVATRFMLRLTLPDAEISLFADGRAIVKGTQRPDIARALYARFVGV
jgi:adenylyltransferase/sulfurtransferase